MCHSCWIQKGQPVVWDEDVAEAVRLLGRLYELEPTGGPLHVEVDDWNVDEDEIKPAYETRSHPDHYSAATHEVCDQLAALLTEMTPGWRASALAHYNKFAIEGQVAPGFQQWGQGG